MVIRFYRFKLFEGCSMPTPKKKTSKSKKGMRRSHDFLVKMTVINCKNCGAIARPHCACLSCGYYKGKEVISPSAS
jgi:large subunit ribosomal protein L32